MGIFDKAKDALSEHAEKVEAGIERAGDFVDDKTGGKYAEHVDKGQAFAKEKLAEKRDATRTGPSRPPSSPFSLSYLLARSRADTRNRDARASDTQIPGCHDPRHPG